jgi:hypothetical protein
MKMTPKKKVAPERDFLRLVLLRLAILRFESPLCRKIRVDQGAGPASFDSIV